MCAVSAIYDYGRNIVPQEAFEDAAFRENFLKLVREAKEFDKVTGQPDCEDSEKKKWWNAIEERHSKESK